MDVLSLTNKSRIELIEWAATVLNQESLQWFRTTLSNMNRKVFSNECKEYIRRDYIIFCENFKKFFTNYADDIHAGYVLYSLFTCAVQLGMLSIDEPMSALTEFGEAIDLDDFKKVTVNEINKLDCRSHLILITRFISNSTLKVMTCGIMTLTNMKYYEEIKGD